MRFLRRLPAALLVLFLVCDLAAAAAAANDQRELTEVERLQVEVQTLKEQLGRAIADADACRADLGPTRTRLNALVIDRDGDRLAAALEAAHPGYRVNRATWQLEAQSKPVTPGSPGTP